MKLELTELEKQRIKLEESSRAEVRSTMSEGKSSSKLWNFLNSQFGLWLITGGLVSLLAWAVGHWNHQREEQSAHR
jgi:hypothetical protein